MKYKKGNFFEIYKPAIELLDKHNPKIPHHLYHFYLHLCYLEHKLTNKTNDYFFRTIKQLQESTKIGYKQIIEDIKILKNLKLIETKQAHFVDKKTGKKSEKHITFFRILE